VLLGQSPWYVLSHDLPALQELPEQSVLHELAAAAAAVV
jgi:hypothetical protein